MANRALITDVIFNTDIASFNAAVNSVKSLDSQMNKLISGATAVAGVFAAGGIASGIFSWAKGAVDKYAELEKATSDFSHALNNLGITSKAAQHDIIDYAETLEKSSMAEKENILNSEKLLATFGLSGETLKKTTKAALDLSAGLGIDLHTATMMLGKAFDGNTSTLSKLGISIDKTIPKAQIFSEVMKQVNERFGGAALAEMDTYAGRVNLLKKEFDDITKSIGQDLMPVAKWMISWLMDLHTVLETVIPSVQRFIREWTFSGSEEDKLKDKLSELEDAKAKIQSHQGLAGGLLAFLFGKNTLASLDSQIAEIKAKIAKLDGISNTGSTVPTRTTGAGATPDNSELRASLSDRLELIKANLAKELVSYNDNYDKEITAVKKAATDEISAIKAAQGQKVLTGTKAAADIAKIEADTAEKVKRLEKEKVDAADKAAKEREQIATALASFENNVNSDTGKVMQAYFTKGEIESARLRVSLVTDSKEAGKVAANEWKKLEQKVSTAEKSISGGFILSLAKMKVAGVNWANFFGGIWDSLSSGFGNAVAQMIVEGKSFGSLMKSLWKSMISEIISQIVAMGVKWLLTKTLMGTASTAEKGVEAAANTAAAATAIATNKLVATDSIMAAAATGAAWAEAASMMSIVGIPLAPAAGVAAYGTIMSNLSLLAFKMGGYTGDKGTNEIAGLVHGGEYVLNAGTTKALGLNGAGTEAQGALVAAMSGNTTQTIHTPISVSVGSISSELDVKKVCKTIADAARYNVKEAVYMANVLAKQGTKKAGYAT